MNNKTVTLILNTVGAGLGLAGLILILLSIFTEKDTLKWGMFCVALGSILVFIRTLRGKCIANGMPPRVFNAP